MLSAPDGSLVPGYGNQRRDHSTYGSGLYGDHMTNDRHFGYATTAVRGCQTFSAYFLLVLFQDGRRQARPTTHGETYATKRGLSR